MELYIPSGRSALLKMEFRAATGSYAPGHTGGLVQTSWKIPLLLFVRGSRPFLIQYRVILATNRLRDPQRVLPQIRGHSGRSVAEQEQDCGAQSAKEPDHKKYIISLRNDFGCPAVWSRPKADVLSPSRTYQMTKSHKSQLSPVFSRFIISPFLPLDRSCIPIFHAMLILSPNGNRLIP